MHTTELYSLLSVEMTVTFIEGHSCTRKFKLSQLQAKTSIDLEDICMLPWHAGPLKLKESL